MVDLGQKKVNASLPFFMPKSKWGGEQFKKSHYDLKYPMQAVYAYSKELLPFLHPIFFNHIKKGP